MNVTQTLVCTGTVIDGLNMVNKGKYAPVTLEHRVYTPTRLPSSYHFAALLACATSKILMRWKSKAEVIDLVRSNIIIKPGKQYSGNLGKSGIANLAGWRAQ